MIKNFALSSVFFLLVGTTFAIEFDVSLDAGQEVPAPNLGGATPSGTATVDVDTITGEVAVSGTFTGLSSDATAAHLHGLAPLGSTAGVLFGLTVDGTTNGSISGTGDVLDNLDALLAGQTYLNLHTANNGPGEIRGQVLDNDILVLNVGLDPTQSVPAPDVGGSSPFGSARVVVDVSSGDVEISGSFTGLTGPATAAHLHGLADSSSTAGVLFGLDLVGDSDGTFSGASTLDDAGLAGLLNGLTYINLHTANNPPGEIRGHLVPEPASAWLLLPTTLCAANWLRRNRRTPQRWHRGRAAA